MIYDLLSGPAAAAAALVVVAAPDQWFWKKN